MSKFQYIAVAIFFTLGILNTQKVAAQMDSTAVTTDTSVINMDSLRYTAISSRPGDTISKAPLKKKTMSRPKKAMLWAMAIPGAGQIYNKKYWKLPILYAGVGALTYFLIQNQLGYSEMKSAYNRNYEAVQNDASFQVYEDNLKYGSLQVYTSLSQLASDRNYYRRYRDLCIAGSVVLYAVSILDAYVDAHLKEFDLNPNLSFSVKPLFYNYNNATFAPGLSLSLKIKDNRMNKNQLLIE